MRLIDSISEDYLNRLFSDADSLCKLHDSDFNCVSYLQNKLKLKGSKVVYLASDSGEVLGFCIVETIDRHYGNLIVHSLHEEDEATFAALLVSESVINGYILELIQFRSTFNYRDTFIQHGLREKERVRMLHSNLKEFQQINIRKDIDFRPLMTKDNDVCGNISFLAHEHRLSIERYDVYSSSESRSKFANDLRLQKHGPSIDSASLLMSHRGKAIGLIETVEVKQWNMLIGWIMDVALLPAYQGIGLGQYLITYAMRQLHTNGYETAGLAVTLTNNSAHQLYASLGFEDYEYFVEILG